MIYSTKLLEEKMIESNENFNLKEAIINGKVNLFFGIQEELIDEYYEYNIDEFIVMIRNAEEHGSGHRFTVKFKPMSRKNNQYFMNKGDFGLPITYDRGSKNWRVYLGTSKENMSKAKYIETRVLTRKEKLFLDSFTNEIGDLAIDYWEVKNIHTIQGKNKLDNIVKIIENKFIQPRIVDGDESQILYILKTLTDKEQEDLYLNDYFSEYKNSIITKVVLDNNNIPIAFADLYYINGDDYSNLRVAVACINDKKYRNKGNATMVLSYALSIAKFNRYNISYKISKDNKYAKFLANSIGIKYEIIKGV